MVCAETPYYQDLRNDIYAYIFASSNQIYSPKLNTMKTIYENMTRQQRIIVIKKTYSGRVSTKTALYWANEKFEYLPKDIQKSIIKLLS